MLLFCALRSHLCTTNKFKLNGLSDKLDEFIVLSVAVSQVVSEIHRYDYDESMTVSFVALDLIYSHQISFKLFVFLLLHYIARPTQLHKKIP